MIISDLNYLEVISSETSVVGGFDPSYVNFKENVYIHKNVDSDVDISGNLATSESDANAYGYRGTLAETFTNTKTTPYSSSSSGTSISASGSY